MKIAIIPARGGSKRIPGKNIKPFLGRPMIDYSIKTAIDSGIFDRVVVSTDSAEIAEQAIKSGAEVPFIRPDNLSDDFTITADVIAHAVNELSVEEKIDYICCLYATAPFVLPGYLKQGYDLLYKSNVGAVFSVTSFSFPIFRALKLNDNNTLEMFWPEHMETRSNDLPEAYHDAGQFYWLRTETFMKDKKLYSDDAMPVILPRHLVQDIDTPEDWKRAEYMYSALKNGGEL